MLKKSIFAFAFLFIIGMAFFALADSNINLSQKCQLKNIDSECKALGPTQCQALLKQCLGFFQKQAQVYQGRVSQTKSKERTLQSEIYYLENKIQRLRIEVNQSNLMIKDLSLQINDTETSIKQNSLKIEGMKDNLSQILRLVQQEDQKSIVEVLLTENKLSDFFDNLAALQALSSKNQELLNNIKALKASLEKEETSLLQEKDALERQVLIRKLQEKSSRDLAKERKTLLKKTKGKESLYRQYLAEANKKAAEIKKRIFELAQVPESQAPNYAQAYALAKQVESVTGVRPAFLLGLLEVESKIGKNVGQCNCANHPNCRHPEISWKQVMPQSQWSSFLAITKQLGLNPNTTPVSCAINGGKVQWGGAMGAAQFMPNTWLKLNYAKRVSRITGVEPANPWRIKDAFLAAGLYLSDWGASSQKLRGEIGAATAYLCGTNRMTAACKRAGGASYRYQVMENAAQWQKWIDEGVFRK